MGTIPGAVQNPATSQPGRPATHWKRNLALGVLALVFLFVAFVGGIFFIVETSFRHSDCYIQGLARAQSNPMVIEKIGQPVTAGWLASGSINVSGPSGNADISIPITGPKGKGSIYVLAKKSAGEWNFQRLEVEIEGEDPRIDLLKTETSAPREN